MKVLHICGFNSQKNYTYRRKKLNDFLKNSFDDNLTTYYSLEDDISKLNQKFDFIIFSSVRHISKIISYIDLNTPIFYDRTDRWSAIGAQGNIIEMTQMEGLLFKASKKVFISSPLLISDIPEDYHNKVIYIPNGCTLLPYRDVEKFNRKTVAIVGRTFHKIDMAYINNLALNNVNYDFNFYGFLKNRAYFEKYRPLHNFNFIDRLSEEDLHKELCKCHIGLVSFMDNDWTSGMLPLKLFNYANAHIPTLYHNCPSITDYYKDISIKDSEISVLDDVFKRNYNYDKILAESDWVPKFTRMMEIINNEL